MATAARALRRLQLGPETTPGTGVAATFKMIGNARVTRERDVHNEDFPRQLYAPVTGGGIELRHGTLITNEGHLTFEEFMHVLAMNVEVPTTTDNGDGTHTHVYDRPWNAAPTLKHYSAEWVETDGNTKFVQQKAAYGTGAGFEVGFSTGDPASCNFDMMLRKSEAATETASLAALTGRDTAGGGLASGLFKVYLDDSAAGLGGTLLSDMVRAGTLTWPAAVAPSYNAEGRAALDFTGIRHLPFTPDNAPTLSLTVELASAAAAEIADAASGTKRFVRLAAERGAHSLQLDGCYVYQSIPSPEADESMMVLTLDMRLEYDATWTKAFYAEITNGLSSLSDA